MAKAIMPKRKALVRRPSGSSTDQFKEIQNYLRLVSGLFSESGILKHIKPQDVILADIGFNVQDPLNPLQAKVKIPASFKVRAASLLLKSFPKEKLSKQEFML